MKNDEMTKKKIFQPDGEMSSNAGAERNVITINQNVSITFYNDFGIPNSGCYFTMKKMRRFIILDPELL